MDQVRRTCPLPLATADCCAELNNPGPFSVAVTLVPAETEISRYTWLGLSDAVLAYDMMGLSSSGVAVAKEVGVDVGNRVGVDTAGNAGVGVVIRSKEGTTNGVGVWKVNGVGEAVGNGVRVAVANAVREGFGKGVGEDVGNAVGMAVGLSTGACSENASECEAFPCSE